MKQVDSNDKINILVVDDHPLFRKGLVSVMTGLPFVQKVCEASNGEEAVQKVKTEKFHLVFMDIEMPVMDGKTAATIIRKESPDTKIIAISINDDVYTIRQMYLSGCDGYLIKNADEDVMREAIDKVMKGNKFFTKEITEKLALESDAETMQRARQKFDFTPAEYRIIEFIKRGNTNKEIARELFLSVRTVENHRYSIFRKTGVNSTIEFINFAVKHRI